MSLWLIILITILTYLRTIRYNYIIDDSVRREGYMYDVPLQPPPVDFYFTKPSVWYRFFMIGMHCVNISIIYLLWGWAPALIFAIHPMSAWGTAWVTGNYYATATYFTLISYFILHTFPNWVGAIGAMPFFIAALNSTVCPINFPFLFLFVGSPWGLTMFLPLIAYLKGERFQTGINIRYSFHKNKTLVNIEKFSLGRICLMVRVMALYVYTAIVPNHLGFFNDFGRHMRDDQKVYDDFHSVKSPIFWSSLLLLVAVFVFGLFVNKEGIFWFFVLLSIHSQFNITGQFYAQRYLYMALPGICAVIGTFLTPYPILLAMIITYLWIRTYFFIPAFKTMEHIWRNDIENFPMSSQVYNNLAQFYMNIPGIPTWRINEVAYLIHKAEALEPTAWEIQMNLAGFFAMMGRAEISLERTNRAIELLEPLGGIQQPLEALKKQKESLEKVIAEHNAKQQTTDLVSV